MGNAGAAHALENMYDVLNTCVRRAIRRGTNQNTKVAIVRRSGEKKKETSTKAHNFFVTY